MLADLRADRDRPNMRLVRGIDRGELVAALEFGQRLLRHEQGARDRADHDAHPPVLPGPEQVLRVGKHILDPQGAGGGVDLAVGCVKFSWIRIDAPVGQDQLELQAAEGGVHLRVIAAEFEVGLLADREGHLDGIERSRPW